MTAKSVLMRPQGLRPRVHAPLSPPPPCYATDSSVTAIQILTQKVICGSILIDSKTFMKIVVLTSEMLLALKF